MASSINLSDIDINHTPISDCGGGGDDEDEFEGKLLHQSCLWDNLDLLNDLLFGDEV